MTRTWAAPPEDRAAAFRSRLDQFYTKPAVAATCLDDLRGLIKEVEFPGEPLFVEPSAGAGAFFHRLPPDRRLGLDLEPRDDAVLSQDFFTWAPYVRRTFNQQKKPNREAIVDLFKNPDRQTLEDAVISHLQIS